MTELYIEIFFATATVIAAQFLVPIIGLVVIFKLMGGLLFDKGR